MRRWPLAVAAISISACATAGNAGPDGVYYDAAATHDSTTTPDASREAPPSSECDPSADHCPATQYCSAVIGKCLDGCRADDGCPEAKPHCDVASHDCFPCLTNAHCPAGMVCSDHGCVAGCSDVRPCGGVDTCCSGACANLGSNGANCGACGNRCTVANGTTLCTSGACAVGDCAPGYGDCNGKYVDGCEATLVSDVENCGKCGEKCAFPHTAATCASGACAIGVCASGFADCNGVLADGCEVDLAHDPSNCGACGAHPVEACNLADDDCNGKCDDVGGCRVGVNRSYNDASGEHFYTTNASEASCCGFRLEDPNYYYLYAASAPGLVALYRCYDAGSGRHFSSTNGACDGRTVEGALGFAATSPTCGATPLHKMYLPSAKDHFYTTSDAERAKAVGLGYVDEGVLAYVWSAPSG